MVDLKAFIRNRPDKAGAVNLYFIYKNIWIPAMVKVFPNNWDHNNQVISTKQPQYKDLRGNLVKRKAEILKAIEYLTVNNMPITGRTIRQRLQGHTRPTSTPAAPLLSGLLKQYAADFKATKAKGYLRKFTTIAKQLDQWKPNLRAKDFTLDRYNAYIDHLVEDCNLENNTVHDHVRKIRLVLSLARQRGMDIPVDFLLFKFKYIDPKPFWLEWPEVEKLAAHTPLDEQQPYLQEFLFRCFTGLRWSDAHQLQPVNFIRNGGQVYLDYTVIKTKLDHNILLTPQAVEILKGWKFKPPKLYAHDCNWEIKKIAKAAKITGSVQRVSFSGSTRKVDIKPKWAMVTTHTARRTFARRWADLGGNLLKLSRYLGHSSLEQTIKYIGYTTKEVNDEVSKLFG